MSSIKLWNYKYIRPVSYREKNLNNLILFTLDNVYFMWKIFFKRSGRQ